MAEPRIIVARQEDARAWEALRDAIWPDGEGAHAAEIAAALAGGDPDRLTLLAFAGAEPVGLAEAAIRRDYVNGCATSPVAFLEGLYVTGPWRRRGIARRLVARAAAWGRRCGCRELASDAAIEDAASRRLHAALGFEETEQVVFFRRMLAA